MPRNKRKLTVIVIAGLFCNCLTFAATIQLTPNQGPVDIPVTVTGSNFTPSKTVAIDFGPFPIVAFALVATDGTFQSTSFFVPMQPTGPVTVTANEFDTGIQATAIFTIESRVVPDTNLEAVLRNRLNLPTKILIPADLAGITELSGSGISDLTGLEFATNLTRLELRGLITDITPLTNLTQLTRLELHGLISDITPLTNLTQLTELRLNDNQISDISALTNLTQLQTLGLDHNQIVDLLPLINNLGIGAGDQVFLQTNALSQTSLNIYLPVLLARGVRDLDKSLPVLLSTFTARTSAEGIQLHWRTESENNNLGFHAYRSQAKDGTYIRITPTFIKGHGTDATPHDYTYLDDTAEPGQPYYYLLENVSFSGQVGKSQIIGVGNPTSAGKLVTQWATIKSKF